MEKLGWEKLRLPDGTGNPGVRAETAGRNTDGHKAMKTLRTGLAATWAANSKVTGKGLSVPVTRDGCLN